MCTLFILLARINIRILGQMILFLFFYTATFFQRHITFSSSFIQTICYILLLKRSWYKYSIFVFCVYPAGLCITNSQLYTVSFLCRKVRSNTIATLNNISIITNIRYFCNTISSRSHFHFFPIIHTFRSIQKHT